MCRISKESIGRTRCLNPRDTIKFNASVADVSAVTHIGPFVIISAAVVTLRMGRSRETMSTSLKICRCSVTQ